VRIAEARRRAVFEAEARVLASKRRLAELEESMRAEGERMKAAAQELDNLERVRRASVALNVWQPQVVHGRQKQLVQQCTVSVDSRVSDLNMELKVCKQQIATYKNSYVCDHLFFTTNEQDKNKTSLTIVVSFSATDRTRRSTS